MIKQSRQQALNSPSLDYFETKKVIEVLVLVLLEKTRGHFMLENNLMEFNPCFLSLLHFRCR
jgi:hypothetical protein